MAIFLKKAWWALALRGIVAVVFGLLAVFLPGITLEVLVLLFVAFSLAEGFFTAAGSLANRRHDSTWWLYFLSGLAGMAIGVLAFRLPGLTAAALVILIAGRDLVVGAVEIAIAIMIKRALANQRLLILNGLLLLAFGVILLGALKVGVQALVQGIGVVALIVGALLLLVAFRVRRWEAASLGLPPA